MERLLRLGDLPLVPLEADEPGKRRIAPLRKPADVRTERRPAFAPGKPREDFNPLMVRLLPRGAAHDGELVGDPGLPRHELADLHPRHVRLDGAEFSADLRGRTGLHVVGIDVARAAAQADHDDRLAPSLRRHGPLRLKAQEIREGQPAQGEASRLEEAPTRHPVAIPPGRAVEEREHRFSLS